METIKKAAAIACFAVYINRDIIFALLGTFALLAVSGIIERIF